MCQLCHLCQYMCANCANKCVPIVSMGVSEFVPAANNFQPYLFTNVRTKVSQQGTSDLKVASCQNFNQMKEKYKRKIHDQFIVSLCQFLKVFIIAIFAHSAYYQSMKVASYQYYNQMQPASAPHISHRKISKDSSRFIPRCLV